MVFTGGLAPGLPAEAWVARQWAEAHGVPSTQIDDEQRSTSTWGNAQHAVPFLHGRTVLVTDHFHAWRSQRVFQCVHGDIEVVTTTPPLLDTVYGSLREVLAVALYGLRGRLQCTEDP